MSTPAHLAHRHARVWLPAVALSTVAAFGLVSCGDDSGTSSSNSTTTASTQTTAPASAAAPAASFSVADVSGLGSVVVDGRGHTVYVLTSDTVKNLPCDDASGCTDAWPDLPLPEGTSAATAGSGLDATLLATTTSDDGETYPTYGGYLMYEFTGDSAAGDGHGQGIKSFGGTWYALNATGAPVTTTG